MNHELVRPEQLFDHLFAGEEGYLVTASAGVGDWQQDYWHYPTEAIQAAKDVIEDAKRGRDTYYGVHLYEEFGNRLADNARPTVRTLWADLDGGRYPDKGPRPTAIIHSSFARFHLYWRLSRAVAVEWAVDMNRRIAIWAGADTTKAGKSSVLRPAGTVNFKREKPELVGGYFTGAPAWEPEVLDQAIPPLPSEDREARRSGPYDGPDLELGPFLENVDVIRERPDSKGVCLEIICPWVHEHSGGDRSGTRIGQRANGALWFHCDHSHCEGRTWREFKNELRRRAGCAQATRGSRTIRMEVV